MNHAAYPTIQDIKDCPVFKGIITDGESIEAEKGGAMERFDILMNAGKEVLKSLYEKNVEEMMDDSEYIPIVKTVIKGIENSGKKLGLSTPKTEELSESLKDFIRQLYIGLWLENSQEEEDKEADAQDGKEYFDYVYEYEEHP